MSINYDKLWKKLIDKKLKKTDLKHIANISSATIAKLGKNEYVALECLERICISLNCDVGEILTISSIINIQEEL